MHNHNLHTLGQIKVHNIVATKCKFDNERRAALMACTEVYHLSLHRCDLRTDWLNPLLRAWEYQVKRLCLVLKSCVCIDDTLHLNGYIPQLTANVYPRIVKVTGSKIIPHGAFQRFEMTTVHLSPYLEEIRSNAFANCAALREVNFTNCTDLKKICSEAIYNCRNLKSIKLPLSLTVIDLSAFKGCTSLKLVDLSDCSKLIELDEWAFGGCHAKIKFVMPSSGAYTSARRKSGQGGPRRSV